MRRKSGRREIQTFQTKNITFYIFSQAFKKLNFLTKFSFNYLNFKIKNSKKFSEKIIIFIL